MIVVLAHSNYADKNDMFSKQLRRRMGGVVFQKRSLIKSVSITPPTGQCATPLCPKDPFVCPKSPGYPLQSYDLGMGCFDHQSSSILLDREGSGFLGMDGFHHNEVDIS